MRGKGEVGRGEDGRGKGWKSCVDGKGKDRRRGIKEGRRGKGEKGKEVNGAGMIWLYLQAVN